MRNPAILIVLMGLAACRGPDPQAVWLFKLTRERVRQIKEKAIPRLRHAPRSKQLRAYLG